MAEKERSAAVTAAWIAGVFGLAGVVITGIFTLAANHGSPQTQPTATPPASSPVSSAAASPADTGTLVASQTPAPGAGSQSAPPSAAATATVSGVPRRTVPGQQVTMHGSGFPAGETLKVAFTVGPGEDISLSDTPEQADSQGRFTFTFTVDSMFCGYDGRLSTYDFGGDGGLLASNPLAVVC